MLKIIEFYLEENQILKHKLRLKNKSYYFPFLDIYSRNYFFEDSDINY